MSAYLKWFSFVIGIVFLGFGTNATFNHVPALSFFSVPAPITEEGKLLLAVLSPVYGIRDIYMGVAICSAALFGGRRTLGCVMTAGGFVAGVDGAVCHYIVHEGAMQHWGYAPVLVIAGLASLILGDADDKLAKAKYN